MGETVLMGEPDQPVVGCGPGPCCPQVTRVTRGEGVGLVVNAVTIPAGQVCEIEWADGSVELLWNPAPEIGHQIDHQDKEWPPG